MKSQTSNFQRNWPIFGIAGALMIGLGSVVYIDLENREKVSEDESYREVRSLAFPTLIRNRIVGKGVFEAQREQLTFIAQLDQRLLYIDGKNEDYLNDARMTAEELCGESRIIAESNYREYPAQVLELKEPNPEMNCLSRR